MEKNQDISVVSYKLKQLSDKVDRNHNEVMSALVSSGDQDPLKWHYWTWVTVSLALTILLKWWLFPTLLAEIGHIPLFIGILLATWITWVLHKTIHSGKQRYRKKPYSQWKLAPHSQIGFLSWILGLVLLLFIWNLSGANWSSLSNPTATLWNFLSEHSPFGVVSDWLDNSSKGDLPSGSMGIEDARRNFTNEQLENNQVNDDGDDPIDSSATTEDKGVGENHPLYPPKFSFKENQRCVECGNLSTGVGRDPLNCDPTYPTWVGRKNNKIYPKRPNCYDRYGEPKTSSNTTQSDVALIFPGLGLYKHSLYDVNKLGTSQGYGTHAVLITSDTQD